jgi:formylglycine-generating enzyme required for sulfatase activity
MNKILLLGLLALGYQSASAQLVTETFGSGANAFSMEFVTIGNPGNALDRRGLPEHLPIYPVGSVDYTYNLGKYEVSRDMITKANSAGSLGITMYDMSSYGGNGVNRPATGISWYEAATYVNWLNTSTGGTAAYKFVSGTFQLWSEGDAGYNASNMFRNSLAKYVIASYDEWHKGAYGNPDGSWSYYPNGTNFNSRPVAGGTDVHTAVFGQSSSTGPADIDNAGGLSAYGTMGQGGNVWEWNETAIRGNNTASEDRLLRGGEWDGWDISSQWDISFEPGAEIEYFGFRVASVPEPSALSLLAIGLGGWAMMRRRRS